MQEKNFEISLEHIYKAALKRWWIILLAVLVCGGAMFGYTKLFTKPSYTSTGIISVSSNMNSYQDTIMGETLANDCAHVIRGNVTLGEAAEMLNAYYAELEAKDGTVPPRVYNDSVLKGMLNASPVSGTKHIQIVVKTDAESVRINDKGLTKKQADEARKAVAREEARVVCDFVIAAFEQRIKEDNIIEGGSVSISEEPKLGAESSASLITNTLLGALVGFVFSLAVIVVLRFFRDDISSEDWLVNNFGERIPVLAVIPDATDVNTAYSKYNRKYGYRTTNKK